MRTAKPPAGWSDTEPAPAPMEWDPAYLGDEWLLDWLEDRGPYAGMHNVAVVRPGSAWTFGSDDPSMMPTPRQHVLTRRYCGAPAPYVGRPYLYLWPAAVDEIGRWIAGSARRHYYPEEQR